MRVGWRVETDGQDNDQGGDERVSNVVRLPRDWLGPREELVPFGPGAWPTEAGADVVEFATGERCAETPDDYTPDDFWSGDLGAIPKPVIATPAAREPAPATLGSGPRPRAGGGERRSRPILPRRRSASVTPRVRTVGTSRTRAGAALAGLAAAGLAVSVVVATSGSSARRPSALPALHAQVHRPRAADTPVPFTTALRPHRFVHLQTPVVNERPAVVRRHRATPPAVATTTYVKEVTSSAGSGSAGSGAAVTTTGSTSTGTTSTGTPVSTTRSSGTTATTARKTQSGPVGPGAPFAPGHLG